jgi:NitT/TauT family transport system substrate-binding protein
LLANRKGPQGKRETLISDPSARNRLRRWTRERLIGAAAAGAVALLAGAASLAEAQRLAKLSYGTNWLAEAEHGGFYQAEADGAYAKYGLDVTIVPGGPNVNGRLLMSSGKLDCFMGSDMINAMDAVAQGLPTIAVAGMFQKDPQVLISHPGEGLDTFESLKNARVIYVARSSLGSFYQWLESRWGFSADNLAPYNFNAAPFLADKKSIQQGYATSEPFAIEKQGGFKPNVFLLADYGFDTASTLCSASSTRRRSAGITISTETTRARMN